MVRKFYLAVVVAVLGGGVVFAGSPLGAPAASLVRGQWSLGADYGFMDADIDTDLADVSGFESNTILANLGYGIADNWELYGLLGFADGEVGGFDSDYEEAYGFGAKVTLSESPKWKWGAVYQMLWVNPEDTVGGVDVEADIYDIKAAFGPTYKINECWDIYGGPMVYYIAGDVDAGFGPVTANTDVDQDVQVGAYGGIGVDLTDDWALVGEYQWTQDVDMIGASLHFKF